MIPNVLSKINVRFSIIVTLITFLYPVLVMKPKQDCMKDDMATEVQGLGLSFGFEASDVQTFFANIGEGGLACYRQLLQIWDMIFPLLYTTMFIGWFALLLKPITSQRPWTKYLLWLPLMGAVLDVCENLSILSLMQEYLENETVSERLVGVASHFTQWKWVFNGGNYLVLLILVVGYFRYRGQR